MRTTLNLDDDLMHQLVRTTHATTKTQAVTQAIQVFIRQQQLEELRKLRGTLRLRSTWRVLEQEELKDLRHPRG